MRRFALVAASALVLAGGAGCSVLGKSAFQQPVVHLRDVRVRGLGITGGQVDVLLSVYNPNHYRLDATRLSYDVKLGDNGQADLANGVLDSHFTVQDNDSTVVTIPVSFSYAGIGAAGQQILNTGAADYKVTGDVTVGTVVGNFTVPYTSSGRFTMTGVSH